MKQLKAFLARWVDPIGIPLGVVVTLVTLVLLITWDTDEPYKNWLILAYPVGIAVGLYLTHRDQAHVQHNGRHGWGTGVFFSVVWPFSVVVMALSLVWPMFVIIWDALDVTPVWGLIFTAGIIFMVIALLA